MTIAVTFLEQDRQRPEGIAGLLAEFITAAQQSLHLAIYDFRLSEKVAAPIVQALRERAARGVEVRIVYDAGKQAVPFRAAGADPAPPGSADFIGAIGDGVQARPITGGHGGAPRLMHHKYVIRDGHAASAALWTGSTNFTDDSWTLQENNIVRVESPELCAYYETDFGELWSRGDIDTTGAHDNGTVRLGQTTVHVAFAPGDGPSIDHDVARRIGAARKRIRVCSMLITSGAILGALGDALHHGQVPDYGGVYDRTQMESVFEQWHGTPAEWKIGAFKEVSRGLASKRSRRYSPSTPHDFMHDKLLVLDDMVVTGSYNLSHSATLNAENVLMIEDADLAAQYVGYIDGLVGRYGPPA
jgi:phosphatidylserine/phosphatidylglycerophosphate/cardiolipin synthase-like enzyme